MRLPLPPFHQEEFGPPLPPVAAKGRLPGQSRNPSRTCQSPHDLDRASVAGQVKEIKAMSASSRNRPRVGELPAIIPPFNVGW